MLVVNLRARDFYKRENYETFWRFLLGMVICTFILFPIAFFLKLVDKITGN
ncbi:putative membrane protein [Bacillus phage vB_BceM_Bc431v3]|uniref:Putative membrane protein n=1 Tax=Bacillus phage vB_BceM_Bc431v3 TaxID=1195072 RepID=M4HNR1_9CAUD|nr:hypothetical protein K201_gp193 [Bacillus phage vB_BceM_Bc431v3]AFQ96501.1 putative membrane protein [Bacillus phage vB_BceM_Bc431v3]